MKNNNVVTRSLILPVMRMSHLCSRLFRMLTAKHWRNLLLSSIRDHLAVIWVSICIFVPWRSTIGTHVNMPMNISRNEDEFEVWSMVVHLQSLKIFVRMCKFSIYRKLIDMMNLVAFTGIKCFEVARDLLYTVFAVPFTISDLSFCYHSYNNIDKSWRNHYEV